MRHSLAAVLLAGWMSLAAVAGPPVAPIAPAVQKSLEQDGTADVLVVFQERPDLRAAADQPTRRARGRFVYEALTAAARRSQGWVRARLEARGTPHQAHYLGNLIRVRADAALVDELARRPEVARIVANPSIQQQLPGPGEGAAPEAVSAIEWGVNRVGAPAMWNLGYTGQGIVIGIQDTGVEWDHPALINKYRGWNGAAANHNYNWHDSIQVNAVPLDDHNHGTHVTGTAVGDDGAGNQIGVAPGARWIGCRNMDHGTGTPATYTECFEFFLAPYPFGGDPEVDGDPDMAPDIISNSWTCPPSEGCDTGTLAAIIGAVRAAGILVVAAAGNAGPSCSSVRDPIAIYDATLSVGATDVNDAIASFSGRGPVTSDGSGRAKPDLAAPGVSVRSAVRFDGYGTYNGTSMASPHVAGSAALVLSAIPALQGDPDGLEQHLLAGARPRTAPFSCGGESTGVIPNHTFGAGIVDAVASILADVDLDGALESVDNCPGLANADQADADLDATGDACDCAPADPAQFAVPAEVPALFFDGPAEVTWSPAVGAVSYDVLSATRSIVGGPPPEFDCHTANVTSLSATTPELPGEILMYLVAAQSCFGQGTTGFGSEGERSPAPSCP